MNGILLVDKPRGFTSHDVAAALRGILRERRVGHAGTLDPMATGLLVVFAGRATRAVQFAESAEKTYIAGLRPGIVTDTQDITGTVLSRSDAAVQARALLALLPEFTGTLMQTPPMYSAVKVGGKKLYELARKGIELARKSRPVTIRELALVGREGDDFVLRIVCSKGTYVRTLCHDIGARLGTGAALSSLRRTAAGGFSVVDAFTLEQLRRLAGEERLAEALLPVDSLFSAFPALPLNREQEKKCRCGSGFGCLAEDGRYRVYSPDGEFLMLGDVESGTMRTVKSFFEPELAGKSQKAV
ncbi:MAG: tRNA pseudouridine(55) synthase TruB [Oscillospiraceae bacterium]|jgi:tRNA pseudouridine55 synthase|nr:tRNA pseudouridine(55) synthase TruB [Oscillospiraceae bacterium]